MDSQRLFEGDPGDIFTGSWPKPNIRDTRGKVMGQHFAKGAKDEAEEAESRVKWRAMTSNRG